jgi:hypothetical protein
MLLSDRIDTFAQLGHWLIDPRNQPERDALAHRANGQNPWFTLQNVHNALTAIATRLLDANALVAWAVASGLTNEPPTGPNPKTVGVVMAGNIPAVGFHDLLCVLVSGHRLLAKTSSQDFVLIDYLIKKIVDLNPAFADRIRLAERLNEADAYIATGSDNTARYFHYYFGKKPHIIRRNRTAVSLLTGHETTTDFVALGHDILDYFGLGCRNVSTLLVPDNYDFSPMLDALAVFEPTYRDMYKWMNNYDYNKSIYLINRVPHLDTGFLLLTESDTLVSPISVVYQQFYATPADAADWLTARADKIQVVSTAAPDLMVPGLSIVPPGHTQQPGLTDYADGMDTLAFLRSL